MVRIINDEAKAKKYIDVVKKAFEVYKISETFNIKNRFSNKNMIKMLKLIEENSLEYGNHLQNTIIKDHLLGGKSIGEIADEEGYSCAHIYGVRHKIYKDFAAILFEVIII